MCRDGVVIFEDLPHLYNMSNSKLSCVFPFIFHQALHFSLLFLVRETHSSLSLSLAFVRLSSSFFTPLPGFTRPFITVAASLLFPILPQFFTDALFFLGLLNFDDVFCFVSLWILFLINAVGVTAIAIAFAT
ncbi:hypothetical protein E2542_SST31182 [Spatholobus suberectus]|nr:hypothetical protein E2542_SST31182 [Spatholobus suberectus]